MLPVKQVMKKWRVFTSIWFWVSIILFLLNACNPIARYKVLSVFFDGVLKPGQKTERPDSLQVAQKSASSEKKKSNQSQKWFSHPATEDNACATCHDDLTDLAYMHAPVEEGECSECHSPHASADSLLLTKSGQDLCLQCHDSEVVKENEAHEDIEDEACYNCHNPHGGENEFYLSTNSHFNPVTPPVQNLRVFP